uniref:Troponin I, fast skeletal muscle n=2 Tax=Callithrix jacchus TaxID=9483 RepID=A0A2R8N9A2_CALJA
MLNQRKWKKRKTVGKKGTAAPYFNEAFTFLVPFSQVQNVDLVLTIWDRGPQLRAEAVGKLEPQGTQTQGPAPLTRVPHKDGGGAPLQAQPGPEASDPALLDLRVGAEPGTSVLRPLTRTAEASPARHRALNRAAQPRCPIKTSWTGWQHAARPGGRTGSKLRTSGWESKQKRNRAITARRQHLKSVMLQIAATELEKEESRREAEKQNYLAEHCPPLHIPGSMSEVQELCKQLHAKIDTAEEEKYDMEVRVQKSSKELEDMNQKLFDLRGKFKRPPLRRVRMSADAMLKALLGSKHKVCMDLRANLKQVKKEDTEKERDLRDVGDWRKNIEEKSGMEGRKKMFESES